MGIEAGAGALLGGLGSLFGGGGGGGGLVGGALSGLEGLFGSGGGAAELPFLGKALQSGAGLVEDLASGVGSGVSNVVDATGKLASADTGLPSLAASQGTSTSPTKFTAPLTKAGFNVAEGVAPPSTQPGADKKGAGASEFGLPGVLGTLAKHPTELLGLGAAAKGAFGGGGGGVPGALPLQLQQLQMAQRGVADMGYRNTGTLPPGLQASLNQARDQAAASIRSQYAARGQSGSSAEQADLANLQTQIAGKSAEIAQQLYETGLQESGMAADLYKYLMEQELQQDKEASGAFGNLVGALGGLLGGRR